MLVAFLAAPDYNLIHMKGFGVVVCVIAFVGRVKCVQCVLRGEIVDVKRVGKLLRMKPSTLLLCECLQFYLTLWSGFKTQLA